MSVKVRNQSPGLLTLPPVYGSTILIPGAGVIINDTVANVKAVFGDVAVGYLDIALVPDNQAGEIQPVADTTGTLLARQVLTGTGTYTPTAGTNRVMLRAAGAGGGGGGVANSASAHIAAGAGGAGGSFIEQFITPGVPITGGAFSAGAAGAAGANTGANGGAGGDTTIVIQGVTYTAKGGPGGTFLASSISGVATGGGAASGSSAGDYDTGQEPGGLAAVISATVGWSGAGGCSPLGAGGAGLIAQAAGTAGTGYGAGGAGGLSINAGGAEAGGAGTAGAIIVYEYS